MRTTLTIDPQIAKKLKELMKHQNKGLKETINDLLACGLSYKQNKTSKAKEFKVKPVKLIFKSGIDQQKLNSMVDDLDMEEFKNI